ncbi:MAG: SprT family zinc-dependent metalloprotease [Candidatus Competibacteraceae bacterium]
MDETLELQGLTFEIRRSARRRTLSLTVDRGGDLVLHAPFAIDNDELAAWARSKLLWVHRKLALKESVAIGPRSPEYVAGESFSYLGKRYHLVLVTEQKEALHFDGTRFLLRRDARPADVHFKRWYIVAGKEWLPPRIDLLRSRTGPAPTRMVVRELGFHWGSCGRDGTLYLNWRVLQFPIRVVDYVLIHELCHLVEPDHRPAFWRMLERALPDWRERNEELHRGTADIFWCAPAMVR